MARNRFFPVVPLITVFMLVAVSSAESETQILLRFRDALTSRGPLAAWNNSIPPCYDDHPNWEGITCDKGSVYGMKLESMGLKGVIDVDALSRLPGLRALSIMNNSFEGELPNLIKLDSLKFLYLSDNHFSGVIPPGAFATMLGLKKLELANNQFSGLIPVSLGVLPKLVRLLLQNNHFEGEIPDFSASKLTEVDLSNNELYGQIPRSLSKIGASAFKGNSNLCGAPLEACASPEHLSLATIIIVSILVALASAAIIAVFVILRSRRQLPEHSLVPVASSSDLDRMEQGQIVPLSSPGSSRHSRKKSEPNVKITFLKEDRDEFDMTDLLKASAEILGSGVFGSTYKAALGPGQIMVVKRFRHMNYVSKEEFHEHMRELGKLNHPNVLPIVGFYYRKEEKLLVADYVDRVSLASHLHGNRSRRACPDWPARLNILKGVARGLLYLYNELPSLTAPHGHLKSSNVLLNSSFTPFLNDYGLVPVVNQEHAQEHMISYKSPEYKRSNRITKKTDVWSLGILIVETLTGRLPASFLQQGRVGDMDVSLWVDSVVNDVENDVDVFDADMARNPSTEGEMMKLLKIGFECCQVDVEMRPDMTEAANRIEEVKEQG